MQIIKIYGSLLDPIIALNKLFMDIIKEFGLNHNYSIEFNNQEIQKILNQNKVFIETVRSNWIYVLTDYPFAYKFIYPKYLKKEEEIVNEVKRRTIEYYRAGNDKMVKRLCNEKEINGLFSKDPKMIKNLHKAFASYILQSPNYYNAHCPSVIKTKENLKNFRELAFAQVVMKIRFLPEKDNKSIYNLTEYFKELPSEFKNPTSKKHLLQKTISMIESNPENYNYCLEEFKKLPQTIEATKVGWIKMLTGAMKNGNSNNGTWFLNYLNVPDELKRDVRIIPILEQAKSSFVDFLEKHFNRLFPPKTQYPYLKEMRMQVEQLIEELAYEDFEISIYGEELEKIKSSPEYKKAMAKVIGQIGMDEPQSPEIKNKLLTNTTGKLFKIKFIKNFSAIFYKKDAKQDEKTYHKFSSGEVYLDVYIFPNDAEMVDVKAKFADGYIYLPKDVFEIVEDTDTNNLVKGDLVEIEFTFPPNIKEYDYHTEQEGIFTAEVGEKYNVYILSIGKDYVSVQLETQVMGEGPKINDLKKTDFKVIGKIGGDTIKEGVGEIMIGEIIEVKFLKDYVCLVYEWGKSAEESQNKTIAKFWKDEIRKFNFLSKAQEKDSIEVTAGFLKGWGYLENDAIQIVEKIPVPGKTIKDNYKDKLMSGILLKIKFNKNYTTGIFNKDDAAKEMVKHIEKNYKSGEVIEVYVTKNNPHTISFQTMDNYIIPNMPKEVFEVAK